MPTTGTILGVQALNGSNQIVVTFNNNCVVANAAAPEIIVQHSSSTSGATTYVSRVGQAVKYGVTVPVATGDAWHCNVQPAAVTVPGGSFSVPESGTCS